MAMSNPVLASGLKSMTSFEGLASSATKSWIALSRWYTLSFLYHLPILDTDREGHRLVAQSMIDAIEPVCKNADSDHLLQPSMIFS